MRQSSMFLRTVSLLLLAVLVACATPQETEDPTFSVSDNDPEMTLAISRARESLPQFWSAFEHRDRGQSDFALKVQIEDSNGIEHFWVTDLRLEDGKIYGVVGNEAEIVASVQLGDEIEVPVEDISDWLYVRDDKMVGNFTLRPLFKQMPPEEVERLKRRLAEPEG